MEKKTKIQVAKYITIFCGCITGFLLFESVFAKVILKHIIGLTLDIHDATSVGIIGGADGPTAVYVASKGISFHNIRLFFLSLITIVCFVIWKNLKKGKEQ